MSRIPSKIGKYQIEGKIAEGGMGAVFRGTHPTLEKPVVLKKLTLSTNEHLIERFRREAKIMMEFSNENIVRVYDHFKNASAYYIVQELVDGKSVDILLKKERYLRYEEAMYIFYFACKALDYAHSNQVVHRDIKPANILLSKNGEIKLVDFGIASSEDEDDSLTKEGMALGTPSYMAPEQYDDSRTVTFKADIYSLGIMLYEMVTGKKPFPGKMNPDTLMKIQKGKYAAPQKVNPTLPASINWYIRKSIQAKPQKRAESVKVILNRLEKWYQSADVDRIKENLIRLVNDEERLPGKPGKKKRPVRWLIAPVILLALGGIAFYLYTTGFHYRTVHASGYGGFRLVYELDEIQKPLNAYHMECSIYKDEGGNIGDEKLSTFTLKAESTGEDESWKLISSAEYLEPGSYWVKSVCDEKVWWKNIFIHPFTDKAFILKPGNVETIVLNAPPGERKKLRLFIDAVDRTNGRGIDVVSVSVQAQGSDYKPLADMRDELSTGKAYNFKIEAEGYYPLNYDLGIKEHQDLLILDAELTPKEGFFSYRLKSAEQEPEDLEILVNGKKIVPRGGIQEDFLNTAEIRQSKRIALHPGNYTISFRIGRAVAEKELTILSEEESSLVIDLITEKNKVTSMGIDQQKQ